jgi:hypothetical protein
MSKNLENIQYSLVLLGPLSSAFEEQHVRAYVSVNSWNIFVQLFNYLSFDTSKEPTEYQALSCGVMVIKHALMQNQSFVDSFLTSPLLDVMIKIWNKGWSLIFSGHFLDVVKLIVININNIFDCCGYCVKHIDNLFKEVAVRSLERLEKCVEGIGKGELEYTSLSNSLSKLFSNWLFKGCLEPSTHFFGTDKNHLIPQFKELNFIYRLTIAFLSLESLLYHREDVKESMDNMTLCICYLFINQTPPVICGPFLDHCFEMLGSQQADQAWFGMENANNVLNEWKKKK